MFVSPLQKLIKVFVYVQQNSKKVFTFVNIRLIIAYVIINDNKTPGSPVGESLQMLSCLDLIVNVLLSFVKTIFIERR